MLEAKGQFRKIIGYRELARLALERELHRHQTQEVLLTLAGEDPSPDRHQKSTARGGIPV